MKYATCILFGLPRGECTVDDSHLAPPSCVFKRYDPVNSQSKWFGALPPGRYDPKTGFKTHSCGWGYWTGRTVDEARQQVFDWLWEHWETPSVS